MVTPNGFRSAFQTLGATHGGPVVCIFGGAQQADLIVVAVGAAPWPGELVGAMPEHKNIHDLLRHDGNFCAKSGAKSQIHHRLREAAWVHYQRVCPSSACTDKRLVIICLACGG